MKEEQDNNEEEEEEETEDSDLVYIIGDNFISFSDLSGNTWLVEKEDN